MPSSEEDLIGEALVATVREHGGALGIRGARPDLRRRTRTVLEGIRGTSRFIATCT